MEVEILIESCFFFDKSNEKIGIKIRNSLSNEEATIKIKFPEFCGLASVSSPAAIDFFFISSIVYCIDRFVNRKSNSKDGWSRNIKVVFPVFSKTEWKYAKIDLQKTLSFLTGDYWNIDFKDSMIEIPTQIISDDYNTVAYEQVNLFSGGLDSLIGAIDFLANPQNKKKNLLMVSHFDSQMKGPNKDQNTLIDKLPANYQQRVKRVSLVEVTLNSLSDKEKTFRSRSILFLGIAVLASDHKKLPIIVPENGSVSLNFPLSSSRRGACSTRTTHPRFISLLKILLGEVKLNNDISNPYEFMTKGEMLMKCKNKNLLNSIVEFSNSCGKRGHVVNRTITNSSHCGVCMPCTYRKASVLSIKDKTLYGDDINKKFTGRDKKTPFLLSGQGEDLSAMLNFLGRTFSREQIMKELVIGGIENDDKMSKYIDLIINTRTELKKLIDKTCTISERRKKAGL